MVFNLTNGTDPTLGVSSIQAYGIQAYGIQAVVLSLLIYCLLMLKILGVGLVHIL